MALHEESTIWQQVERSESYLICSMYDEAATLSSSILKSLVNNSNNEIQSNQVDIQLVHELKESAGMVFVQSLNRLGRTGEILNELKHIFDAIADIPAQVVLTGVCLQITEGSLSGVREFLEEFLDKWSYVDEGYYVVVDEGANVSSMEDSARSSVLEVEKYLEVVEVYVVALLGKVLNDRDAAISWVENAALPEENRQALLRRLSSLYSLEATNMSDSSSSLLSAVSGVPTSKELYKSEASPEILRAKFPHLVENANRKSFLKLSRQVDSCFWLFPTITLRFGETRVVLSNGKILLGCLVLIVIYVFRKKRATLLRIAARQVSSIKKALIDLWRLAFSYQVNPLAAVQPPSSAARGVQR